MKNGKYDERQKLSTELANKMFQSRLDRTVIAARQSNLRIMSFSIRYLFSFGILVFGLLVPILPRFYMIYIRFNNPERYKDVFTLLHSPLLYLITVIPFGFLSVIAWFSLKKNDLSQKSDIRRISGVIVSLIVLGYWGLAVSMPTVWGLAAIFFLFGSILVLPLTYWWGGLIGYWFIRWIFPEHMCILEKTNTHLESSKRTTLLEMLKKSCKK